MNRMLPALAVAAGAALALAGCTTGAPDSRRTATASGTPLAAKAQIVDLAPLADGVVATGTFSGDGTVTGGVSIVKSAAGYDLELSDFAAPADADLAITSEQSASSPGCYDFWRLDLADPATWSTPDVPDRSTGLHIDAYLDAGGKHPDLVDPTFLSTVVVTTSHANGRCLLTTLATATLTWTVTSLRPELVANDGGPIAGASGSVNDDSTLYTVATGDQLRTIAARFDFTIEDLMYLNPISITSVGNTVIYPGQVFNLTPTGRGHPSIHHD